MVIVQENAGVFSDSQVDAAQVEASANDDARSNVSPNVASQVFDADGLTVPGRAKPLVLKDYSHASSHLRQQYGWVESYAESLNEWLEIDILREQCRQIPDGMSYPGSSEVIESLIGKYKQSQGQHSRGGFTKMLLTIGASVVEVTESVVVESLTAVRELDVRKWTKDALGTTLSSMRRLAFPGTKVE